MTPTLNALVRAAQDTGSQDIPLIDMSPSIMLILAIGAFVTAGVYLLTERSLTRVLLGVILIGNGINLLFLVSGGRAGGAPIVGATPDAEMSDPLPQAMVLTAIVITLGLTAFVLAMAYRSWQLLGHDEVQDDLEDRRIARIAARNAPTIDGHDSSDSSEFELNPDDDAAEARDETSHLTESDDAFLAQEKAKYYSELAERATNETERAELRKKAEWWTKQYEAAQEQDTRREDPGNDLTEPGAHVEQEALEDNTSSEANQEPGTTDKEAKND